VKNWANWRISQTEMYTKKRNSARTDEK